MEFRRFLFDYLIRWKEQLHRKPLILRGARQVGKTTLVRQFAKTYEYAILLNLEKPDHRDFFERFHDVRTIKDALFLSHNISSGAIRKTLLFIDEIQESPKAIHLLRYFYEELPDLHVIAAGSLLEFAMRKVPGFPVGRVEYLYLHPLNFPEYLLATGHQAALDQLNQIPLQKFAHQTLLDLYNRYAIVGGMPEVVSTYLQSNSLADLPEVYESIWGTYQNDVEKYTTNESERRVIKHIINTAHLYVNQRIKFQNFGNSNYRSREVGEALRNLDQASVIRLIYPTTDIQPPVRPDLKKSPRLQFLDTGILNHTLGIQSQMLAIEDLNTAYRGAIIPHLITQELISLNRINNPNPNFWVREKIQSSSEVDLVITYEGKLIPIEIKSGKTGTLKSLHQFTERADHPYTIRLCAGEFSVEKAKTAARKPFLLMNLPYYSGTKILEYIAHFVNNYSL